MKRIAIMVGLAAFSTWSILAGCGGDDAVPEESEAGADGTSPADGGGGGSDGSVSPGTDGSTSEAGTTDGGGGGSNPGKVTCGTTECATAADGGFGFGPYCCVRADGGATCETAQNACFNGLRLRCDEKADCTDNGDDCCLSVGGGGFSGSSCQNNCFGNQARLCKTSADCGDGGACSTITCGGRQYRACNKPPGCT
ncbi:MAG: hypothetical protein JST00_20270 [Deltaproteobacteria bacterium]|nr:hypothetical protein [Deltaproteobacteria bacterium]